MEFVTLVAILAGPVLAIMVSRWLDNAREQRARKMDIFRTLMRTRRTPIYPEHVGALNLIEIEFAKDEEVIEAWKSLLQHFATRHVRGKDEETSNHLASEEDQRREDKFYDRLFNERQRLLAKLLHAIAKRLGFKVEQLEIFEGGYTPQGWNDIEQENRAIRRFVIDLYQGRCLVPVGVVDYTQAETNAPPGAGQPNTATLEVSAPTSKN